MKNPSLSYSLKVWLTSVVVGPALHILLLYVRFSMDFSKAFSDIHDMLITYLGLVILSCVFSIATWLLFWLLIAQIMKFLRRRYLQKMVIFICGVLLTLGTFMLFRDPLHLINNPRGLINLMYANCFCIGTGVWLFRLEKKTTEHKTI